MARQFANSPLGIRAAGRQEFAFNTSRLYRANRMLKECKIQNYSSHLKETDGRPYLFSYLEYATLTLPPASLAF